MAQDDAPLFLRGVPASDGIAIGPAFIMEDEDVAIGVDRLLHRRLRPLQRDLRIDAQRDDRDHERHDHDRVAEPDLAWLDTRPRAVTRPAALSQMGFW